MGARLPWREETFEVGSGIIFRMKYPLTSLLRIGPPAGIRAALLCGAAGLLVGAGQVAGRADAADEPTILIQATMAAESNRHGDALPLFDRALGEALAAGSCGDALVAANGIRNSSYWARDHTVLIAASERLSTVDVGECQAMAVVELALGLELAGKSTDAKSLLKTATASVVDPAAGFYLDRAERLMGAEAEGRIRLEDLVRFSLDPNSRAWRDLPIQPVNRLDQVREGADAWSGPEDASLDVRSGRILSSLYVQIRVRDDDFRLEGEETDHVVLTINPESGAGTFLRRDPLQTGAPVILTVPLGVFEKPETLPGQDRMWRTCVAEEDGYTMMVCIPKESVPEVILEPGYRYAFDVGYRDVDADGASSLQWMGRWVGDVFLAGILEAE